MWDLKLCELEPEVVEEALRRRGIAPEVHLDHLGHLLRMRRALVQEGEAINAARKRLARDGEGTDPARGRALREQAAAVRAGLDDVEEAVKDAAARLPNRPQVLVPDGQGEEANVVAQVWGAPPAFDFEPRDHVWLGQALGLLDLPRGAKVAGAGFPCLTGLGARLSRALAAFMLDLHRERAGYLEVAPPFVSNRPAFFGTGQLPRFEDEIYWTDGGELGLVPTAEVPLTNLYRGEIVAEADLPIRLTAWTPCWRREAGAHGRDARGLIRVHQFEKVELVQLVAPEASDVALEALTDDAEEVLRRLELPFRRVALCAGDLGFSAARTYDLEVWLPSQARYREVSSCSNCEAFQARRMMLRVRRKSGDIEYLHTLNGSGLAVGRTWVALLENGQQADGSVRLPAALVPYLGVDTLRPARGLP